MRRLISILIVLVPLLSKGQAQLGFYDFGSRIPQTSSLNPAFFPDAKVSFAFPAFGSTGVFVDTDRLSLRRIFEKDGDSLVFVPENMTSYLKKRNRFEFGADVNTFFLGIAGKNNFFSLSSTTRAFGTVLLSKQAIEWILYGPADERNLGQTLDFSDLGAAGTAYHEFAFGYARKLMQGRLTVGLKLKYLSGIFDASVRDVQGYLYSGIDSIRLYNETFTMNTAGVSGIDEDAGGVLAGFANSGFGFDFGVIFKPIPTVSISASLIDVGSINWDQYTKVYEVNSADYVFDGFDALDLLNGDDLLQDELDSLENMYDINEVEGTSYKTRLVKKVYLGARWQFHPKQHASLIIYNDYFNGHVKTAYGLNYGVQAGRNFDAIFGISYRDRSFANFNFGFSVNGGPLQFYVLSENINSFIWSSRARKMDLRFGINLLFGRPKPGRSTGI